MKDRKGLLATVLITTALLFLYYGYSIINADSLTFGQEGDGYKNYYTLAYYLRYDTGAHFSGMNYPYGEQVLFTDNQPAFAWLLKIVTKVFPALVYHLHGIITWIIFLSIVITAVIVFKTLRKLGLSQLTATAFSVLIAMLSPQVQRLNCHYSLAYTFFVPLILYLLLKLFTEKATLKNFAYLTLTITVFSFIHIYYMAMAGLFILAITLIYAVSKYRNLQTEKTFISLLVASAIVPFIILKTFLLFTDHVSDRPHAPWGFVAHRSTVADIFLHHYSFTGEAITGLFPKAKVIYHFEGLGYIGLVSTITLFIALIWFVMGFIRKDKMRLPYPFNYFLPAAIAVLLFAMAFPFSIDPIEKYYNLMPAVIKQFRASGRFSWVFYYTATIFSAVLIANAFERIRLRNKYAAYTLLFAVVAVWGVEVNMISIRYERDFKTFSSKNDEVLEEAGLIKNLKLIGKTTNDFQAILPLPFFLNGSEKLYIESSASFCAMKTSLYSGLPVACGQLSRTSLNQTLKIVNLVSSDLIRKDILNEYHSKKPLLLLSLGYDMTEQEWKLVSRAKWLFKIDKLNYYELPLSAFDDSTGAIQKFVSSNKQSFYDHGNYFSTDTNNNVLVKRFEEQYKDYAIFGKGAWFEKEGNSYFYFDTLPGAKDSTDYQFSVWFYADDRTAAFPLVILTEPDSSGKDIFQAERNGKFSTNTFGKWVRQDINFRLYNRRNRIYIVGQGNYGSFDELMVRPINVNVVTAWESDSNFMYNNFPIR